MQIFAPDTKYDFIGKWRIFCGASIAAVVISLALLAGKGLNFGIDFTGGTLVQVQFKADQPIGRVREAVSSLRLGDTVIQNFGSEREFLLRVERSSGSIEGEFSRRHPSEDQLTLDEQRLFFVPGLPSAAMLGSWLLRWPHEDSWQRSLR